PEISNSRRDENHHASVIRNVNSQQENPANQMDSNQETPTLNCRNDQNNQIREVDSQQENHTNSQHHEIPDSNQETSTSNLYHQNDRNFFYKSTFNKCTFNYF
ncbi:12460_t:CDS:1, partial [Gigaspora margarita]